MTEPEQTPKKPISTGKKIGWAVAGVMCLAWAIAAASGSGSGTSDGYGARHACEGWVKDQLKAPSTADFNDGEIKVVDENKWLITGTVDAQNGFGAQIRTSWTCAVHLDADDYYRGSAVSGSVG